MLRRRYVESVLHFRDEYVGTLNLHDKYVPDVYDQKQYFI